MEKNMDFLWAKLDAKLNEQTATITKSVTKNVLEALDEKLRILSEENNLLKNKVTSLEQKLTNMEKVNRKYNLVFFGVDEKGKTELELVDYIKEIITETGTHLESNEIRNVYRIGQRNHNKNRPVIVSISAMWKKHIILKNKAKLPANITIKEDYPKDVIEKRKQLQPQLEEERKKGNWAYLNYDKLIVKEQSESTRDKRKREESSSPKQSHQKKVHSKNKEPVHPMTTIATKEVLRANILNFVERGRSHSSSENPKNE